MTIRDKSYLLDEKIDFWSSHGDKPSVKNGYFPKKMLLTEDDQIEIKKILKNNSNIDDVVIEKKIKINRIKNQNRHGLSKGNIQVAYWHKEKFSLKNRSTKEKLNLILEKCIHFIWGSNSCHVDMNIPSPHNKGVVQLVGWGGGGCYEDEQPAIPSRCVTVYDVDLKKIFPKEKEEDVKNDFINNINYFKNSDSFHDTKIDPAIFHALSAMDHRDKMKKSILSYFVKHSKNNEKIKANFCSSVVVQIIILAHLKTCIDRGFSVPDNLTFYGLDKNEKLENLTPKRIEDTLIRSGILKKTFSNLK